jgi:hypothetical protein
MSRLASTVLIPVTIVKVTADSFGIINLAPIQKNEQFNLRVTGRNRNRHGCVCAKSCGSGSHDRIGGRSGRMNPNLLKTPPWPGRLQQGQSHPRILRPPNPPAHLIFPRASGRYIRHSPAPATILQLAPLFDRHHAKLPIFTEIKKREKACPGSNQDWFFESTQSLFNKYVMDLLRNISTYLSQSGWKGGCHH